MSETMVVMKPALKLEAEEAKRQAKKEAKRAAKVAKRAAEADEAMREAKEDTFMHRGAITLIKAGIKAIKRTDGPTKLGAQHIVDGCATILKKRFGPRTIHTVIVE